MSTTIEMLEGVRTLKEHGAMLLLTDYRGHVSYGNPEAPSGEMPRDTVEALPGKREALRATAKEHGVSVRGEVILEIESGTDLETALNKAIQELAQLQVSLVMSLDRLGLEEAGIFGPLLLRLQEAGYEFVEVT